MFVEELLEVKFLLFLLLGMCEVVKNKVYVVKGVEDKCLEDKGLEVIVL